MIGRALCGLALAVAMHGVGDHPTDAREDGPEPLYSPDPADPWNRIHHLLFTRRIRVSVLDRLGAPARLAERVEGGDLPLFMAMPEAGYLLEEPRYRDLTRALGDEIAAPTAASRTLEARVLFQQDLWNRFDAVSAFLSSEQPEAERERARRLRDLLGRAMARAACAAAELARIPPSLGDAAREFPDALDPRILAPDSGWKELVSTGGQGPVESDTTEHARRRWARPGSTSGLAARCCSPTTPSSRTALPAPSGPTRPTRRCGRRSRATSPSPLPGVGRDSRASPSGTRASQRPRSRGRSSGRVASTRSPRP